ncbi:MAG: hypothetical protein SFU86_20230 [Pirellulaceae bacterium]|nr:hypothetical protein [Pirellulaceae bacterium]
MRLPTISLRALFLLGFAVGMPVLALPAVARRIDTLLYGPAPAEFLRPPSARPLQQIIEPERIERVSPANFEDFVPPGELARQPHEGIDALASAPPPLAPPPVFAPPAAATSASDTPTGNVPATSSEPSRLAQASRALFAAHDNPADVRRLIEIRQELERLGAEYILLETTDEGATYRFHCQMPVSEKSPFTRPFEQTAANPLAAGELVLREVSTWRAAANSPEPDAK